jgi:hypothetical protein
MTSLVLGNTHAKIINQTQYTVKEIIQKKGACVINFHGKMRKFQRGQKEMEYLNI